MKVGLKGKLEPPKKKYTTLGIDINSNSVRIVQMREDKSGKEVLKTCSANIPSDLKDAEKIRVIAKTITEMLSLNAIKNKEVILGIPDALGFIGNISVPVMPDKELKQIILLQSERICPFALPEAVWDFNIRGEGKDKEGMKTFEVIIACAAKQTIEEYISILEEAKLKPVGISLKPFALANSFKANIEPDKAVAIIDLGKEVTTIVIIQEGGVSFVRPINLGTDHILKIIAKESKLDPDKILTMNQGLGIPLSGETEEEKQIFIAVRSLLERLINEIDRSFGYYSQQTFRRTISKVILTGEVNRVKNIDKFLAENLKHPVEVRCHSYEKIIFSATKDEFQVLDPQFSTAIGLADRAVLGWVNLLPSKLEKIKNKFLKLILGKGIIKVILTVLIPLFLFSYLSLVFISGTYRAQLEAKQEKIVKLKFINRELGSRQEIKLIEDRRAMLEQLIAERFFWSDILREVSKLVVPDSFWTNNLSYKDGILKIGGSAFSQNIVTEFVLRLSQSDKFKDVNLGSTKEVIKANYKVIDFEINCKLR